MSKMANKSMRILLAIILFSGLRLVSQEVDPNAVIDSTRTKLEGIVDYQADIEIEVDVDFINMPLKHATIYFKKPDKVKFKSDEFIMLPKRGLNNRITQILDDPYTAIYLGNEMINEIPHYVIRIVPMGKNPDIVLATWWISSETYLISKSESNTRNDGNFMVDFIYGDRSIILPTEMVFSFQIEKLKLPLKFIGKSSGLEVDKSKMQEPQNGKVYLRFSNYLINTDLRDDLFSEDPDNN